MLVENYLFFIQLIEKKENMQKVLLLKSRK